MWSRQPPVNKNIDPYLWDAAERMHALYKRLHSRLLQIGLDEARADTYLDEFLKLQRAVEMLDPTEEDFFVDDHSEDFSTALDALRRMALALGYSEQVK